MGYAPSAYVVDLDRIVAFYGSRDTKLVDKIASKHAAKLKDNAEWFTAEIAKGAPRLEEALREIAAGKCTKKKHGFQYAYALELLCAHLGKTLGAADFVNWTFLESLEKALPKKDAKLRKLLSSENVTECKRMLVPIPRPTDFPGMGAFDTAQCKTILAGLKHVVLDEEATYGELDGEEMGEGLEELTGWFAAAVKAKRGLMLFTY